jgi:hypothetical protein
VRRRRPADTCRCSTRRAPSSATGTVIGAPPSWAPLALACPSCSALVHPRPPAGTGGPGSHRRDRPAIARPRASIGRTRSRSCRPRRSSTGSLPGASPDCARTVPAVSGRTFAVAALRLVV